MDHPKMVRVTLEIEAGADPPRGQVLAGQAAYPFAGWLGLATALEHAISAGAATPPSPRPLADER
jgi:hypothetical protein